MQSAAPGPQPCRQPLQQWNEINDIRHGACTVHELARQSQGFLDHGVSDTAGAKAKGDGEHVVQRAATCVRLGVDMLRALHAVDEEGMDHIRSLKVQDPIVRVHRFLIEPDRGDATVLAPVSSTLRSRR